MLHVVNPNPGIELINVRELAAGLRPQCPSIPLRHADVWMTHVGQDMTLWRAAIEMVWANANRRMHERGQLYVAITRIHKLEDFWRGKYEECVLRHLLSLPHPIDHTVDEWIDALCRNGWWGTDGSTIEPPSIPSWV